MRYLPRRGKGSHGALYVGGNRTIVKRSSIAPGLFHAMLKQLDIAKEEFEMHYVYPCVLTPEDEGGFFVSFPDVPEALTGGASPAEALGMAEDALVAALSIYVREREELPVPSAGVPGQACVAVPTVVAAKLALYTAMRRQGITKLALAERLGLSEGAVRKLCDPDHRSHIGGVEDALRSVGRGLVVGDRAIPESPVVAAAR